MPNTRSKAEQIVTLLRQIEVGVANGKTTRKSAKKPRSRCRPTTVGGRNRRPDTGSSQTVEGTGEREHEAEASVGGTVFGEAGSEGYCGGKLLALSGVTVRWSTRGRSTRLPQDHGAVAGSRLAGGKRSSAAHLASRRAKYTQETKAPEKALAQMTDRACGSPQ
jgi:hypothetical protein